MLEQLHTYPYHLQLELIDYCRFLADVDEPFKSSITSILHGNMSENGLMLNTAIFEALSSLGALELDSEQYASSVRQEIKVALENNDNESDAAAWGIFSCQFDHPYDSAYWNEVQNLDESRKKLLLTKACRGAASPHVFFLSILIRQLSEFDGPEIINAISKWTELPDTNAFLPQDAIDAFFCACEALGRLRAPLPIREIAIMSESECALTTWGALIYYASDTSLPIELRTELVSAGRKILIERCPNTSAGTMKLAVSRLRMADGEHHISPIQHYPSICIEVCRNALSRTNEQTGYFQHGFNAEAEDIAAFSIQVLGEIGGIEDLPTIRHHCDHAQYGKEALAAISKIEGRVKFRQT